MFDASVIEAIKAHAINAYPEESCGFVVDGVYLQRQNTAEEPEKGFRLAPQTWAAAAKHGEIQAVVHSHPHGPDCPSEHDMRLQIDTAVPWGIVATDGEGCREPFWFGDQVPIPELVGRGFRHGVTDCYSLIRDWYRLERDVTLPVYPREWEWWREGEDLYQRFFGDAGFVRIHEAEVQAGDVFLAQIRSPVPNHGGIYVGRGLGLHHLAARLESDFSRLSVREPVNRWRNHITHWLRYDA